MKPCALLAEDDPAVQRALVRMLERLGLSVDAVMDGQAAVQAARGKDYRLIMLDGDMPGMGGLAAASTIRASGEGERRVPIVYLTGADARALQPACAAAGIDDCLSKPVSLQQLRELVSRWVADLPTEGHAETRAAAPPVEGPSFEPAQLRDVAGQDGALLDELCRVFLASASRGVADIQAALARGDVDALPRLTHRLKGTASMVGAVKLSALAARIERRAGLGLQDGAAAEELTRELAAVWSQMRSLGMARPEGS